MGKTFIAAVIIYNFHLWFNGKIFFFAPTKPLVNQQKTSFIRMFENLEELVCEINGTISLKKKIDSYREKRIFFMTPQTFENDLNKNYVNTEEISLIIFDEAHKAQKKYSYSNIINFLNKSQIKNSYRVIALSASPGSNSENIQNILENLKIKKIEIRTENDADLKDYLFHKHIELVEVDNTEEINKYLEILISLIKNRLDVLKRFKIIASYESAKSLGTSHLLKYHNEFKNKKEEFINEIGPHMIKESHYIFSVIFKLLNCKKLLLTQGLESFKESIKKFENVEFEEKRNSYLEDNSQKNLIKQRNLFSFKFLNKGNFTKDKSLYRNSISSHIRNSNYISPLAIAKKRVIDLEDFKKLKKELFSEENFDDEKNKISNTIDRCFYNSASIKSKNYKKFSQKECLTDTNNNIKRQISIEIEVEKKDYFKNPYYNLFNNYKNHFDRIVALNKTKLKENELTAQEEFEYINSITNNLNKRFYLGHEIHPKLKKLESILLENTLAFNNGSKAIIFTQYIDSADEIKCYLEKNGNFSKNEITFEILKGQKKGFNQKTQAEVIRNFKDGITNILIATCVAEEGIDIEDVDLIVCYDIISTSPIKIIQRFGRTGRKRDGKVFVLCTKGEEKYKFFRAMKRLKLIQKDIKSLKFEFEAIRIKDYENYNNILYVDKNIIEKCEYFRVEKEIGEKTEEDLFSEYSEQIEDKKFIENDLENLNEFYFNDEEMNVSLERINLTRDNKDTFGIKTNEVKEMEECIIINSDDEFEYNNKGFYYDKMADLIFDKQKNNADLYLIENSMKKLKENFIKKESNTELPKLMNTFNAESNLFNYKDEIYFSDDQIINLLNKNDKENYFSNQNQNHNTIKDKDILNEEIQNKNLLDYKDKDKDKDKDMENNSIIKFKIFKRKSADGRKFLTSKDLEMELNSDLKEIKTFEDSKNNLYTLDGFKEPFPLKNMKESNNISNKSIKNNLISLKDKKDNSIKNKVKLIHEKINKENIKVNNESLLHLQNKNLSVNNEPEIDNNNNKGNGSLHMNNKLNNSLDFTEEDISKIEKYIIKEEVTDSIIQSIKDEKKLYKNVINKNFDYKKNDFSDSYRDDLIIDIRNIGKKAEGDDEHMENFPKENFEEINKKIKLEEQIEDYSIICTPLEDKGILDNKIIIDENTQKKEFNSLLFSKDKTLKDNKNKLSNTFFLRNENKKINTINNTSLHCKKNDSSMFLKTKALNDISNSITNEKENKLSQKINNEENSFEKNTGITQHLDLMLNFHKNLKFLNNQNKPNENCNRNTDKNLINISLKSSSFNSQLKPQDVLFNFNNNFSKVNCRLKRKHSDTLGDYKKVVKIDSKEKTIDTFFAPKKFKE